MANHHLTFLIKQRPFRDRLLHIALGVSSIAFGPILGGVLTEFLNWRWMFLYNIPVGIIILWEYTILLQK